MRLLLLLLAAAIGCGEPPHASHAPPSSSPSAKDDALCSHGVVDELCPKHHPRIAVVFQQKGDWCAEHGFPESICPQCHPERGGRPSTSTSADGSAQKKEEEPPADGTPVKLRTPDVAHQIGIRTTRAVVVKAEPTLAVSARLAFEPARHVRVNARVAGVVRSLDVNVGDEVTRGRALLVLASADAGDARGRLAAAEARAKQAQQQKERQEALVKEGIAAERALQDAAAALDVALADLAAAREAGALVGNNVVESPLKGTVLARDVVVGQAVAVGDPLLTIVDASVMSAEVEIPEQSIARVQIGQATVVDVGALPGRSFTGKLAWLSPEVRASSRTVAGRVLLDNPRRELRANMIGTARISLAKEGEGGDVVVVPRAAVQDARGQAVCFVQKSEGSYETRRVRTGAVRENHVEILAGVAAGEDVVVDGAFLLKTETLKDAIGAGCCE